MPTVPVAILLSIGALLIVTAYLAHQYWRSIRQAASELGWVRALLVAVGNVALVIVILWLASIVGLAGVQFANWTGQALGLPESVLGPLTFGTLVIGVIAVTILVALLYDRFLPHVTRSFQ